MTWLRRRREVPPQDRRFVPGGAGVACPACGSPHVEHERGLLFCGTCGTTTEIAVLD